jgi:hypothetical protein
VNSGRKAEAALCGAVGILMDLVLISGRWEPEHRQFPRPSGRFVNQKQGKISGFFPIHANVNVIDLCYPHCALGGPHY